MGSQALHVCLGAGLIAGCIMAAAPPVFAAKAVTEAADQPKLEPEELGSLEIEELANIKVTLAAREPQPVSRTPAAITIITNQDIERDGAPSIAEALRLAPGVQVGRIDSARYAISIRGFNSEVANRLLVLQDHRLLYTPTFGGVLWEAQDTLLEDIEYIETIRGPGSVLWSASAINGVINIQTKHARDTQGWLINGGGGNEERAFGAIRYGGTWGENRHYRVWAKGFHTDDLAGGDHSGGVQSGRVGFRSDFKAGPQDEFMLSGEAHRTWLGSTLLLPRLAPPGEVLRTGETEFMGAGVVGRWTRTFNASSEIRTHLAYDRYQDDARIQGFRGNVHTIDADFQHNWHPQRRHVLVWGGGYRHYWDSVDGSYILRFSPPSRETHLASLFAQDEIELWANRLWLTLGAKLEQNSFTGLEWQPGGRVAWMPLRHTLLWGAITRGYRIPTRGESDANFLVGVENGALVRIVGNPDLLAEPLTSYQLGYRALLQTGTQLDIATFFNEYGRLNGAGRFHLDTTPNPPELVARQEAIERAKTYGGELSLDVRLGSKWYLRPGYSYLQMDVRPNRGVGAVAIAELDEGSNPHHQFFLRGGWLFTRSWRLDSGVFYVSELEGLRIPAFWDLHARMAWMPLNAVEISVAGRNLLGAHSEFRGSLHPPLDSAEVEPSVYGKLQVEL